MNIHSATTKGPNKKINQDFYGISKQINFTLLIVADGLGSAINSDFGSKTAVRAVEKAIIQWRKLNNKNNKVLIQLIHFFWNLLISDSKYEKKDCSTTCLFAYIDKKNKKLLLGQLGDGIVLYKSKKKIAILQSKDEYNYTKSLGSSKYFNDWNIKEVDFEIDFELFLATDGVSEDLKDNEKFVTLLINNLSDIKKNKRNKALKQLLEEWPTKHHSDDKTICIAWKNKK